MLTLTVWLHVLAAMSVDFFRVSAKELRHPTIGGISPSLIWGYRIANVLLNGLNAFW